MEMDLSAEVILNCCHYFGRRVIVDYQTVVKITEEMETYMYSCMYMQYMGNKYFVF